MGRSPYKYKIKLSGKEKRELRQARRKGCKKARLVIRILIVLLADAAKTIAETATILGCCEQTVLNQRKKGRCCFARFAPFRPSSGLYGPAAGADYGHGSATLHEHNLPLSRFSVADLLRVVPGRWSGQFRPQQLGSPFAPRCPEAMAVPLLALSTRP